MADPSRVRVTGPLTSYTEGFAAELQRQGYTPVSASRQLQLATRLSHWLASEGLNSRDLSPVQAERLLNARRTAGYANHLSSSALGPLLSYLRGLGAAPPPAASAPTGRWRSCWGATGATSPSSGASENRPSAVTQKRSARS